MLNLKFAWISDPAANTMQTAVWGDTGFFLKNLSALSFKGPLSDPDSLAHLKMDNARGIREM